MGQSHSSRLSFDAPDQYDNEPQGGLELETVRKVDLASPGLDSETASIASSFRPSTPAKFSSKKSSKCYICTASLIIIAFALIAVIALGLSAFNLVNQDDGVVAETSQQAQENDRVISDLMERIDKLEASLKEMSAKLNQNTDILVELNSSHVAGLLIKVDLLDARLNFTVTNISMLHENIDNNVNRFEDKFNRTASNVSSLAFQISESQSTTWALITSLDTKLNETTENVTSLMLNVAQLQNQTQSQIALVSSKLNTTVANVSSLVNQVSSSQATTQSQLNSFGDQLNTTTQNFTWLTTQVLQSQDTTQSQLSLLGATLNTTGSNVNSFKSLVSSLQSMQNLTQSRILYLDADHNDTVTTLSSISSQMLGGMSKLLLEK